MLRIIVSTFCLLVFHPSFGKNETDNLTKRIDKLEQILKEKSNFSDSLVKVNNSIKMDVDYKENLLEKYNTLNSNIFTIISLLLAFFGVIVPVIGYVFLVQPTKENIKEAQILLGNIKNNLNDLFEEYTKKNRDSLIDKALLNLEQNNVPLISNSLNTLSRLNHERFNEKQSIRIIRLIKDKYQYSNTLMQYLCSTENEFNDDFFLDSLIKYPENRKLNIWSAIYGANFNKDQFLDPITEFIIKTKDLTGISSSIKNVNFDYFMKVFNNKRLINEVDNEILKTYMFVLDQHINDEPQEHKHRRQSSGLYKKYLDIKQV